MWESFYEYDTTKLNCLAEFWITWVEFPEHYLYSILPFSLTCDMTSPWHSIRLSFAYPFILISQSNTKYFAIRVSPVLSVFDSNETTTLLCTNTINKSLTLAFSWYMVWHFCQRILHFFHFKNSATFHLPFHNNLSFQKDKHEGHFINLMENEDKASEGEILWFLHTCLY